MSNMKIISLCCFAIILSSCIDKTGESKSKKDETGKNDSISNQNNSALIASPVFKIDVADFFNSDTNLLLNIYANTAFAEADLECNYKFESDMVADCFDSDGNLVPEYEPNDSSYELDTGIKILTSKQVLATIKKSKYMIIPFFPMSFAIYKDQIYIPYSAAQKVVKYSMLGEKIEDVRIKCTGDPVHCLL
jgi:hypothetical protein